MIYVLRVAEGSISSLRDSTFFFEKCFLDTTTRTTTAKATTAKALGSAFGPRGVKSGSDEPLALGTVGFWTRS